MDRGILRVEVDGGWELTEFRKLLSSIERNYFRLAALSAPSLTKLLQRRFARYSSPKLRPQRLSFILQPVVRAAKKDLGELTVERIEIASPGLFELAAVANIVNLFVSIFATWRNQPNTRAASASDTAIAAIGDVALHGIDMSTRQPLVAENIERIIEAVVTEIGNIAQEPRVIGMEAGRLPRRM